MAAKRKKSGLALCDICAPWVETSMSRMEHVPSWMETRYGYLWDSKAQMDTEIEIMHDAFLEMCDTNTGGDWSSGIGTDTPCPGDTEAWVEFLTWVLDGEHPDLISRVRAALSARESAREPETPWTSVETIRNRLKMLVDERSTLLDIQLRLTRWVLGLTMVGTPFYLDIVRMTYTVNEPMCCRS